MTEGRDLSNQSQCGITDHHSFDKNYVTEITLYYRNYIIHFVKTTNISVENSKHMAIVNQCDIAG